MIDVDRNTHNQGVLSKGATVDPAETLACIGELTPFPEEYTPQYLLVRISVNPVGRFGFIRSLFLLLFRPCQFYLK